MKGFEPGFRVETRLSFRRFEGKPATKGEQKHWRPEGQLPYGKNIGSEIQEKVRHEFFKKLFSFRSEMPNLVFGGTAHDTIGCHGESVTVCRRKLSFTRLPPHGSSPVFDKFYVARRRRRRRRHCRRRPT